MTKKLTSFVLLAAACLALPVSGDLTADSVAHWTLDEAIGDVALDSSGNGHDAGIYGDGWKIVAGQLMGAIELNGNNYALATDFPVPPSTVTVTAWVYANSKPSWGSMVKNWGSSQTGQFHLGLDAGANNLDVHITQSGGGTVNVNEGAAFPTGEWQHVAFVADGTMVRLYRNGAEVASAGYDGTLRTSHTGVGIGMKPNNEGTGPDGGIPAYWDGLIDDVWILSRGLTPEELQVIMEGRGAGPMPQAFGPDPKDGAMLEATWANLTWRAGDSAVSHDVYIGEDFDDVSAGAEGTFVGNQAATTLIVGFVGFPIPDGLVPGTIYYWRVDEVNDTDPNSPWKGDVWSFSITPKTAHAAVPADGAESVALDAELSWAPGFAAKLHTVYFGDNYDDVNSAAGGLLTGEAVFTPPGPLELAKTYYWRVDEYDPPTTYRGAVWSFRTEGTAADPIPAKGAIDVSPTPVLRWAAGNLAASHEVYLGADADAVANAGKTSPEYKGTAALGEEVYDAGRLELMTTYYWRVDEVNSTQPGGPWIGNVWTFTTGDFLVVDDFESYDDIDPPAGEPGVNRIFDKWIDGFGTLTNGALIGNALPPYAEQTIVHGGAQSMNYAYDNAGKTSEATLTLVYPRDWTEEGVTKLSLWFRGDSASAPDRIYVALNGTAVVYHDDASATHISGWTEWVIDLAAFGVDLTNVNTITIGIGTKNAPAPGGGQGTMYFDDIRLYR